MAYSQQISKEYAQDNEKRGYAVLLTDLNFDVMLQDRERQRLAKDKDYLNSIFLQTLGFEEVRFMEHKTWEAMQELIKSIDHTSCDCFVFAASLHGTVVQNKKTSKKEIQLQMGEEGVFLSDIFKMFDRQDLKGKPKLFFINACSVDREDGKTQRRDVGGKLQVQMDDIKVERNLPVYDTKSEELTGSLGRTFHDVTLYTDCFFMLGAPPGMFSYRDQHGSWMFYSMKKVIDEYNVKQPDNFLKVLTKVNWEQSSGKQSVAFMKDKDGNHIFGDNNKRKIDQEKSGMKCSLWQSHVLTKDLFFREKLSTPSLPSPDL